MSEIKKIVVVGAYNSGSTAIASVLHRLSVGKGAPCYADFLEPEDLGAELHRWYESDLRGHTSGKERVDFLSCWLESRVRLARVIVAKHPLLSLCLKDIEDAWGDDVRYIWARRPLDDAIRGLARRAWFPNPALIQRTLWRHCHDFFSSRDHLCVEYRSLLREPAAEVSRIAAFTKQSCSEKTIRSASDAVDNKRYFARRRVLDKHPACTIQKVDNRRAELTNRDTGDIIALSASAIAIWHLLDGRSSLSTIAAELQCSIQDDTKCVERNVLEAGERLLREGGAVDVTSDVEPGAATPVRDIDIIVVNRAADTRRMARAKRQLEDYDLSYDRFEAIDRQEVADKDMRRWLSREGYGLYRKYGGTAREGSMTPGALACALSWRKILETRKSSPRQHFLILEDDFNLCGDFKNRFDTFTANLPADFDLIYLSWNRLNRINSLEIDDYTDRLYGRQHGTGAILINKTCIPLLLNLFPLTLQWDHDIPDKLICTNRIRAFKGFYLRERLIENDNLDGSKTQGDS